MKNIRLLVLLLLSVAVSTGAFAQKSKLQRANEEFKRFNFDAAIPVYLEILQKTDLAEAKINVAECYRKVGNTAEAEYWFGQVVHLPEAEPKHFLYYGQSLQANGKCDLAKEWFVEYSKREPDDLRGQLLSKTCDPEEIKRLLVKSKEFYEVHQLPINTQYDDFGPVYHKGGIVFASERDDHGIAKRKHEWTGYPFLELFFTQVDTVDGDNFEFTYERKPGKYEKKLNTKYHDGPISFSAEGDKIFVTRNNLYKGKTGRDEEGIVRLKIFTADVTADGWKNLQELPFNSDEYSVAHPTISQDGKTLYFSSDMPGGFGGMDLYYTEKDGDSWSPPQNLGPRINTEGHEVFPYIHPATEKLYFASDGHIGIGRLDVYSIQQIDGTWGPVTNIGAPINSQDDDFGIILNDDETFGYFTSNRDGGVGRDDIYSFKRSVVEVEVLVYDQNTDEPISAATVFNDCSLETLTTASNGRAVIEMPVNKCCNFTANKETYLENRKESCTDGYEPGTKIFVKIPLTRPMDFALEGQITDQNTGEPISQAIVMLTNDCDEDVREFVTAEDGRYHFDDLEQNCCYFVTAKKTPYYLAPGQPTRVCTRGKKKSERFTVDIQLIPAAFVDNNNPDNSGDGGTTAPPENPLAGAGSTQFSTGQLTGATYIIEHIYYDFDKYYIRDDAEQPLENLINLLSANPEYIVEIGSHTDARGSDRYNQWLSRKRAKAVVEYLVNAGINRANLTYQGYGETTPSNECFNEVPCTEEQHQRNRRTEFRLVGTIDGVEFARSSAPAQIKIDPCVGCPF